jgi:hypothetical protein
MEVHPPHHPLLSWRDFFVHIATITIGLLIAIALEQTVEAIHHRHQRLETRENLRREIAENREVLARDLKSLNAEHKMLEDDIVTLRRLRSHQPVPADSLHFDWRWSNMPDSAWQTARETSSVALFPAEQVQGYSTVYGQQALVNAAGIAISTLQTTAAIPLRVEPDLASLSPALIDELIHGCAATLNQIEYTQDLARSLDPGYQEVLNSL